MRRFKPDYPLQFGGCYVKAGRWLSDKYRNILGNYVEWSKCTVPLTGYSSRFVGKGFNFSEQGVSPEESMYRFETYGEHIDIDISQSKLGWQYINGKANRDFWSKEKGWWDKNAVYLPEEFLVHLMPLCFIEMFSRPPRVHLVRYVYDNFYTDNEYERDMERCWKGYETVPGGVEFIRDVNTALSSNGRILASQAIDRGSNHRGATK